MAGWMRGREKQQRLGMAWPALVCIRACANWLPVPLYAVGVPPAAERAGISMSTRFQLGGPTWHAGGGRPSHRQLRQEQRGVHWRRHVLRRYGHSHASAAASHRGLCRPKARARPLARSIRRPPGHSESRPRRRRPPRRGGRQAGRRSHHRDHFNFNMRRVGVSCPQLLSPFIQLSTQPLARAGRDTAAGGGHVACCFGRWRVLGRGGSRPTTPGVGGCRAHGCCARRASVAAVASALRGSRRAHSNGYE